MEISVLMEKNEQELLELLGNSIRIRDEISPYEKGKLWLQRNKSKLQEIICPRYSNYTAQNQTQYLTDMIAAVNDYFLGVPATIVAVLILKIGLANFCKTN